jgi:hypothetical protein
MRMLAIVLVLGACVSGDETDAGEPHPADEDSHASITAAVGAPDDAPYDVCDHVPAEPPCSLICDPEALVEYVPERSCAVFVCTLTDGQQVAVHACHPGS